MLSIEWEERQQACTQVGRAREGARVQIWAGREIGLTGPMEADEEIAAVMLVPDGGDPHIMAVLAANFRETPPCAECTAGLADGDRCPRCGGTGLDILPALRALVEDLTLYRMDEPVGHA